MKTILKIVANLSIAGIGIFGTMVGLAYYGEHHTVNKAINALAKSIVDDAEAEKEEE